MISWFPNKTLFAILPALLSLELISCAGARAPVAEKSSTPGHAHPREDLSLAHDFFLRARSQEIAGNNAAALNYYQLAFSYNRTSRDLCFLLLGRYRELGMVDSAIAIGKACFALKGKATSEENQAMGEAWLRRDDVPSALPYYEEAVRLDEDNREILFVLVGLYEKQRDLPRFTAALRKLLPLMDYPPRLADKLIQIYGISGQVDSIGSFLHEAWKKTGQTAFAEQLAAYYGSLQLRGLLSGASKKDSVLNIYGELLEKNPGNREILYTYALLFQDSSASKSQRRTAVDRFRAGLAEMPGNSLLLFHLGVNLERTGQRDSAVQVLRRLVDLDTLNSMAMNYLGYMLVEDDRDLDFAGRLLDRALILEPENGAYLDSKGWWCYRKKDFRAAQTYLLKAADRIPGDPTIREHLNTVRKLLDAGP